MKKNINTINIEELKTLASYIIDNNKRLYNEHKRLLQLK